MSRYLAPYALCAALLLVFPLGALAQRPSLNKLNADVNQLEAENQAQQEVIDALVSLAVTVKAFQLVGFTETTVTGDAGILGMTQACQAEFPASKMCASEEIAQTVKIPTSLGEPDVFAWVRPSFEPHASNQGALDVSGLKGVGDDGMTCRGWTTTTIQGLAVAPSGGFALKMSCDVARPVSCCALIPVPEP